MATQPVVRCAVLCAQPSTSVVLGADVTPGSKLVPVTVAGDGVVLYDAATQGLETSYPLGGAGRASFAAPAVLNDKTQQCATILCDSVGSSHRLVSWPVSSSRKQRVSKPGGTFTTIADVPTSIPLPSPAHSLYALHTQGVHATTGTAVVFQDGGVGFCGTETSQVQPVNLPDGAQGSIGHLRGSCAGGHSVHTLHQSAAGQPCVVHDYNLQRDGSGRHGRSSTVPCPSQTAVAVSIHAASSYTLITWSSGCVTLLKQGGRTLHIPLPQHLAPTSITSTSAPTATPGSKRKAPPAQADDNNSTASRVIAAPVDSTQFVMLAMHREGLNAELRYAVIDQQYGCAVGQGVIDVAEQPQLAAALRSPAGAGTSPAVFRLHSHPANPGQLVLQLGSTVAAMVAEARPANLLALVGRLAVSSEAPGASQPAAAGAVLDVAALTSTLLQPPAADAPTGNLQPLPAAAAVSAQALPDAASRLAKALQKAAGADQPAPAGVLDEATQLLQQHLHEQQQHQTTSWPLFAQLLPLTAAALAKASRWDALEQLLRLVPQQALFGCGQLLVAAAQAGQYQLVPRLCVLLGDLSPEVVVDTLSALLTPTAAFKQQRMQYQSNIRHEAEGAISNAEACLQEVQGAVDGRGRQADQAVEARREAVALAQYAAALVDGFTVSQVLLHAPLSVTMDTAALPSALKRLSNRQVDRLLSYLALWLDKYTNTMSLATSTAPVTVELLAPTLQQVNEWVRLLVDAHLPRLLIAKDLPSSIVKILQLTRKQVDTCRQLMSLAGIVDHVQLKKPLPAAHQAASSHYQVQLIDLGIQL